MTNRLKAHPFTVRHIRMRLGWLIITVALGGCVTSTVMQVAGTKLEVAHKADKLLSAYKTPEDNIVIFVKGRLHGVEGNSEFSLLVPNAELQRMKTSRATLDHDNRLFSYKASIGPSSTYAANDWTALPVRRGGAEVNRFRITAEPEPVVYELPKAPGAVNEKDLKETWGNIILVYVEPYANGGTFRIEITSNTERLKGAGSLWLPATVSADILTLPAQALWAALFAATMSAK